MKDFTRLKTRKLTCNHRHINKVNGRILCCNENVTGILKKEEDCVNCLACTGKIWPDYIRKKRT